MKSNLLLVTALLGASALTSCSLDKDVNERTYSATLCQLVIPDDISKDVSFNNNITYNFTLDLSGNTINITSSDFVLEDRSGILTSGSMKYNYVAGTASYVFKNGTGRFGTSEASGINGYLTSNTTVGSSVGISQAFIVGYHANGATVKTYYPDVTFVGETKTFYSMGAAGDQEASTKDASYRVTFAEDMKKATVIIYNIKFAPNMPKPLEAILLRDLNVSLGRDGYTISGTDVIPELKEGNGTTPFDKCPFESFTLRTVNEDLTKVKCDYVVSVGIMGTPMEGRGEFNGIYASSTGADE